jgi:hypothetical protein
VRFRRCTRGATWGPDGTIIFATTSPATGLQRVSAAEGEPTVLTKPDRERGEGDHLWPEFLPGGEAVLRCEDVTRSVDTDDGHGVSVDEHRLIEDICSAAIST